MCYQLLLSTSCERDLTRLNSKLVVFSRQLPEIPASERLNYRNRWYVGSKSGCSCTFRHLHSVELGFGAPVDWYPEEADEIAATGELVGIIRDLLAQGELVDCIDSWEDNDIDSVSQKVVSVDLAEISDDQFRLFENHHFVFVPLS